MRFPVPFLYGIKSVAGKQPAVVDPRNAVRNTTADSFEMMYKCDVSDFDEDGTWATQFPNFVECGCAEFTETMGELQIQKLSRRTLACSSY